MDEFLLLSLKIIIEISLEFWMVYSCEVVVASKYGGLTRYKKVVRKKFCRSKACIYLQHQTFQSASRDNFKGISLMYAKAQNANHGT